MPSSPCRHAIPPDRAVSGRLRALALALALPLAGGLPALAQFPDAPRAPLPPLPERRAALLKEFDADHDGRLAGAEREAARKAWAAQQFAQRGDRGFFQPPPELMEEFDQNKDGELDEAEGRRAMETMGARMMKMQKDYDANANQRLDPDEIAAALKAVDEGKLKGIPRMFIQFAGGPPGGPGGRGRGPRGPGGPAAPGAAAEIEEPAELIHAADRDGNGRLDAAELETARAALARRRAQRASAQPPRQP